MENIDYGSIEYAKRMEETEKFWRDEYGPILEKFYKLINLCLMNGQKEAHRQLSQLLQPSDTTKILSGRDTSFAYMTVIKDIYDEEVKAGVKNTVFNLAHDMDGLIAVFIQLKFLVFELEFIDDAVSEQLFLKFVTEYGISAVFVENMISFAAVDRDRVRKKIKAILGW